jgi:cytochrome o ubiquinol oxidase subunit II
MGRPSWREKALAALGGASACVLAIGLSSCGAPVLDPQGPVAAGEERILLNALAVMLCIIVPVIVATLGFAWWFRASNTRARFRPDWAYSGRIELVTWSIPLLVIVFLGGVTWIGSHELDPARPLPSKEPPLEVQVVSLDWKWLFIYPAQGVASVNRLVIPSGTPVHFTLTSASVMNTFFIPSLGGMIYTMNGMADQLWLQADHPGRYRGQSSHFSGDGFSRMSFQVEATPAAGFSSWVASTRTGGPKLDGGAYGQLARQSQDVHPYTYASVAPGLFDEVVSQRLAPGSGPGAGPAPAFAPPQVFPKGGR